MRHKIFEFDPFMARQKTVSKRTRNHSFIAHFCFSLEFLLAQLCFDEIFSLSWFYLSLEFLLVVF